MNLKKSTYSFLLLSLILLSGCGHVKGTTSVEKSSYLLITGNQVGVDIKIDDLHHFTISKEDIFKYNNKKVARYQLATGKYVVKAFRDSRLLVHREIFLSSGQEKELYIP